MKIKADNNDLLMYALAVLGIVLAYVGYKFMSGIVSVFWAGITVPVFGDLATATAPFAIIIALLAVLYAWRNDQANKFGVEVVSELRKVTWPNWKEIKGATLIVLGVTFAVSFVLFLFDKIYDGLVGLIFRLA